MRGRRFAPAAVLALVLASGGLAGATEMRTFIPSVGDLRMPDTTPIAVLDPSGKPVGGCYVEMRAALAAAAEYVRDPDEISYANTYLTFNAPCRICDFKAEIKRLEQVRQAAAHIRDILARCP